MQKSQDRITLYYKSGNSDKVYRASIEPAGEDLFTVEFAYGRRGNTLQTGTKTKSPVPYDQAREIYDKLVKSKTDKGYTPGEDGTPYVSTDNEDRNTGVHCQLLNPIKESELDQYFSSTNFIMQEKHDGRRLLIRKLNSEIIGINRRGLETGLSEKIAESANSLPGDFIIDGEAVGDTLYAFDLLENDEADLRNQPYRFRFGLLTLLLSTHKPRHIRAVDAAVEPEDKRQMFERIRKADGEGVVIKKSDAFYTPGRPNSGGTQLKYKFVDSASCLVLGRNGSKRSVALGLLSGDDLVKCGNVTVPANHDLPLKGSVVEVRYLYAYPESNALYQPVYLGRRDDIPVPECVLDQLRYKAA